MRATAIIATGCGLSANAFLLKKEQLSLAKPNAKCAKAINALLQDTSLVATWTKAQAQSDSTTGGGKAIADVFSALEASKCNKDDSPCNDYCTNIGDAGACGQTGLADMGASNPIEFKSGNAQPLCTKGATTAIAGTPEGTWVTAFVTEIFADTTGICKRNTPTPAADGATCVTDLNAIISAGLNGVATVAVGDVANADALIAKLKATDTGETLKAGNAKCTAAKKAGACTANGSDWDDATLSADGSGLTTTLTVADKQLPKDKAKAFFTALYAGSDGLCVRGGASTADAATCKKDLEAIIKAGLGPSPTVTAEDVSSAAKLIAKLNATDTGMALKSGNTDCAAALAAGACTTDGSKWDDTTLGTGTDALTVSGSTNLPKDQEKAFFTALFTPTTGLCMRTPAADGQCLKDLKAMAKVGAGLKTEDCAKLCKKVGDEEKYKAAQCNNLKGGDKGSVASCSGADAGDASIAAELGVIGGFCAQVKAQGNSTDDGGSHSC